MRSVCVVGFAPQTRELANAEPSHVELWGLNIGHVFLKRWDRWFQVHPFVWQGKPMYGRDAEHLRFLQSCTVPLYMNEPTDNMPMARPYPYEEVYKAIGRRYLTSTGAHAIALAIAEGVDELKVYGINVATDLEYVEQRPCIEYLLGLAEGRGIKVVLPEYATLLRGRTYPLGERSDVDFVAEHLKQARSDFMKSWAATYQLIGAYKFAQVMGQDSKALKLQLMSQFMRLQKDRGKVDSEKFILRRLGGTDSGYAELPDIDIPADLLSPEGVMSVLPNVVEVKA